MTETFTGSLKVTAIGTLLRDIDLGSTQYNLSYSKSYSITNGTSSNQCNNVWTDTRTIAASGTDDIDLAGGIANAFGTTLTFTAIKGIVIEADSANTNNVLVGGDAAALAGWTSNVNDVVVVRPGGIFVLYDPGAAGYTVTGTTADVLQIANSSSGTSVTYNIIILGEV